jgi:phage FluMu protein Com
MKRRTDMPDAEITITCPVCEHDFKKMTSELPQGAEIKCPKCGEQTTIRTDMFTNMFKSNKKS